MQSLSRGTALMARLGVLACAVVGLWLGGSKGYSASSDSSGEVTTPGEHIASAKAIAPPPAPTFDEAAIRRIAKEEAQALVARNQVSTPAPVHRKAPASSGSEYTTPSDAGIVYARPPRADSVGGAPASPATPPPVAQF